MNQTLLKENGGQYSASDRLEIIAILRIYCTVMNTFISQKEASYILLLMNTAKIERE